MKKFIFIVLCLVTILGLSGLIVNRYQELKPVEMTVSKSHYDDAVNALRIHDAVNAKNLTIYQGKIDDLTTQKTNLCTALKATKNAVVPAICQ